MSQYIQTIALNDVKCFAHHGWYPEEQLTGTWFHVDVSASFPVQPGDTEDLQRTVNYEQVNSIILQAMATPRKLLETVVKEILDNLISAFPFVCEGYVTIRKQHPPMAGEIGESLVRLTYNA